MDCLLLVQRDNAVDNFRAGRTWVLVATDVVARGMDFKGVNCVINYDFPESAASYIHRIGMNCLLCVYDHVPGQYRASFSKFLF